MGWSSAITIAIGAVVMEGWYGLVGLIHRRNACPIERQPDFDPAAEVRRDSTATAAPNARARSLMVRGPRELRSSSDPSSRPANRPLPSSSISRISSPP